MFQLFADRADLDFTRVVADVISRSSGCDCCSHWKHMLRLLRSGVSFEGHRFVSELSVYVMVFDCLLSLGAACNVVTSSVLMNQLCIVVAPSCIFACR